MNFFLILHLFLFMLATRLNITTDHLNEFSVRVFENSQKKETYQKKNQVSFHIFKKMFIYLPKILSAINLYI